jgi:hypothetical protein
MLAASDLHRPSRPVSSLAASDLNNPNNPSKQRAASDLCQAELPFDASRKRLLPYELLEQRWPQATFIIRDASNDSRRNVLRCPATPLRFQIASDLAPTDAPFRQSTPKSLSLVLAFLPSYCDIAEATSCSGRKRGWGPESSSPSGFCSTRESATVYRLFRPSYGT